MITTLAIIGFITLIIALVSGLYYLLWGRKEETQEDKTIESFKILDKRFQYYDRLQEQTRKELEYLFCAVRRLEQKENK